MIKITGTQMSYYFYCKRRLWLHSNDIRFEDLSDDVALGVLIEESAYQQRSEKYSQVEIGAIKVDFYSAVDNLIHEVKKSSKFHETHIWQLKYYIYIFEKNGIEGVTGILEYPKERKTEEIFLGLPDRERIEELLIEIEQIISSETCPEKINSRRCKNCSYYEFCYVDEIDEDV